MKRVPIIKSAVKPKFVLPGEKKKQPSLLARIFLKRASNFAPHLKSGVIARASSKNPQPKPKFSKPQQ